MPCRWPRIAFLQIMFALAALAGGCAALGEAGQLVATGSIPDGRTQGSFDGERYVVSAAEEGLPCRVLKGRTERLLDRGDLLAETAAREREAPPTSMAAVWHRVSGAPDGGSAASLERRRVDAEAFAFNELLGARGCGAVDIGARQALRAAAAAAMPR